MSLREFQKALEKSREIEITVTGRTSGREISIPVNFVREGDTLYLLPVRGSDTDWYKNVLKTPSIRLAARGTEYTSKATPITDSAKVREIVEKFLAKYGEDEMEYYSKLDVAVEVPLA